jgi:hypothetical protein
MQGHGRTIIATAFALSLVTSAWAVHDADVSNDESKCQLGTSLAVAKFVTGKAKCVIKCEQGARKALNPATDCDAPYAGATADCVQRAEVKAQGLEQSKCAKDCPECYTGGDCTADSIARVADAEAEVDTLVPAVYCDDSGSGDGLTAAEAKCQDTVAKTLSNFARKKLNCYAKCRKAEHKGTTPPGSCGPPAAEAKAVQCINKEETKAAALIDKKCETTSAPNAEKPECYTTSTGTNWVAIVELAIDQGQGDLYCGSPSGAFLDDVPR